ncbi:hypothetical protein ACL02O_11940 [Micromonospora sp. MS34]|uniref:hypothetical protein n=1 Tax=Micromonospora sp. MS34 TaxID=3385971 RepID=UPI0039A0D34F
MLLAVVVTAANTSDNTIGINLLEQARAIHSTLAKTGNPWSTDGGSSNAAWAGHAAPTPRPRLRSPIRQLRQHDPHRDDRQLDQTHHQRNHPNLARQMKAASPAKYVNQPPS